MKKKYSIIAGKINEAIKAGDTKALKKLRKQLEKWQKEYGAYQPVK